MKKLGIVAVILGLIVLLGSFGFDTAPEGTHNIGLLQEQMMIFQMGGLLILVGTLLTAFGIGLQRMEKAGLLPPASYRAPEATSGETL